MIFNVINKRFLIKSYNNTISKDGTQDCLELPPVSVRPGQLPGGHHARLIRTTLTKAWWFPGHLVNAHPGGRAQQRVIRAGGLRSGLCRRCLLVMWAVGTLEPAVGGGPCNKWARGRRAGRGGADGGSGKAGWTG